MIPRSIRQQLQSVTLPEGVERHFGTGLTFDQLDSEILGQLNMTRISDDARRDFRDLLYSQQLQHEDQVAIPAGIPLLWLERLPILGRTRGAVRRAFGQMESGTSLIFPMSESRFLEIRSVGMMGLIDLACVLESAERGTDASGALLELKQTSTPVFPTAEAEIVTQGPAEIIENISPLLRKLNSFGMWALAETDSRTLGEAVAEACGNSPGVNEWEALVSIPLSAISERPLYPYTAIDAWASQLEPRSKDVFLKRIANFRPNCTLQELSEIFGVTRERIRQIESRVRSKLNNFLASDEALPVRWRAETIRRRVGVASPSNVVESLLSMPNGCPDYRAILLDMAGPYDESRGWAVLRSAKSGDPTPEILAQTDEVGRINLDLAGDLLSDWGLDEQYHLDWLIRDDAIKLFNGQLVLWGASIPDRMAFALADIGHPSDVDHLMDHVAEQRVRGSVVNALSSDPRFAKADLSSWTLASWGLPEFSGVPHEMRNLLEANGGSMPIDEVIGHMGSRFGVIESTSRAYCYAPMFVVEGDNLRVRTRDDEPFSCDPDSIWRTKGIFHLGTRRVSLLINVEANILRGSGSQLTHAAGAILNVQVNDNLTFTDSHDAETRVTFPESVLTGPSLGSIRLIAERLGVAVGDLMLLVLDRSDMTISAYLVNHLNPTPGWDAVGSLTGIPRPVDLNSLAAALRCQPRNVRSVLRNRGDTVLLDLLPRSAPPASLDEALDVFEAEFGNWG